MGDAGSNDIAQALQNTGRANLEKARFFAAHVEDAEHGDDPAVEEIEAYLSAAIVFGKATQDWLVDRYGRTWLKQSDLWNDPVCKFFADVRNVVVHDDGAVQVISRTHLILHVRPATMFTSGTVAIFRSFPSNGSLFVRVKARIAHKAEDFRVWRLQRKVDRARVERLAQLREEASAKVASDPESGQIIHFHFLHDDPLIAGPSALRVVNDYLDLLHSVLIKAQISND